MKRKTKTLRAHPVKQLPPENNPDIPQDFIDQLERERDRQVDELTQVAERILGSVPQLVALKIKSIRPDWSQINFALAGIGPGHTGEPGQ